MTLLYCNNEKTVWFGHLSGLWSLSVSSSAWRTHALYLHCCELESEAPYSAGRVVGTEDCHLVVSSDLQHARTGSVLRSLGHTLEGQIMGSECGLGPHLQVELSVVDKQIEIYLISWQLKNNTTK